MTFTKILLGLIAPVAFAVPAIGQQTTLPPTQLALEVRFYPKEAPGYQVVPASNRSGAWWARFARVPGWKQPTDSPAVTAVSIKSEIAEDGVRVWVSVYLGERLELEKSVASYLLHEREQQTVRELADFGVEPFEIKLVRVNLSATDLPQFTSKAKSIEVVVMQPNLSTMPSFEIVVRNVSNKNVSALRVQVFQSARPQIMSMPQGKEGQVLIPPGGSYEFTAKIATRAVPSADGYTPFVLPNQVIEVSTAVFDDGTFEGDTEGAFVFAGYQKGRALQLQRIIGLFDSASEANDSAAVTLASLREMVATLSIEASATAVQEVQAKFPSANQRPPKAAIEAAMRGVRDDALNEIVQFQLRNRRVEASIFHEWLTLSKQRYQAWLNRL